MNIPTVDLKAQYESIKEEVRVAIDGVLASSQYILGPEVKAFEEEMAEYCNVKYAIGVASGTDALHLALRACGIKSGDEVITTPFTFVATAEVIKHCGATPVFADINKRTYNIDPAGIETALSPQTKAIIPVHLYGQPSAMDEIMAIAEKHSLKVIEDCAQALGGEYKGKKAGSIGDAGCLSFFPSKILGAYGDGGMIVTDDSDIAEKARMLRVHGAKKSYHYTLNGFNSRLDAIQAAILRVKLRHLGKWVELRNERAALYSKLINDIDGIDAPHIEDYNKSSHNYYTICLSDARIDRDEFRNHLSSKGIKTMVYYPLSLHLQETYSDLGYKKGDFPVSEWVQDRVVSLPMYPELSEDQIRGVTAEIGTFIKSIQTNTNQ